MTVRTNWKYVISGLVLALLVTACGQAEVAAPTATEAPPEPDVATATETMEEPDPAATDEMETEPTATEEPEPAVSVGQTSLGEILVDSEGFTLYVFTQDGANQSTCATGCVEFWPPLAVDAQPVAGEGIDESLLGTITRDDGSMQVTYAGLPLYTYAEDLAPGDVNGQGFSNAWYVLGADGEMIQQAGGAGGDEGDDLDDLY